MDKNCTESAYFFIEHSELAYCGVMRVLMFIQEGTKVCVWKGNWASPSLLATFKH